jgi:NADPH:quinone reductase-like Zn-dependent oxidoreductase
VQRKAVDRKACADGEDRLWDGTRLSSAEPDHEVLDMSKAMQFSQYGDSDVLKLAEVSEPTAGPSQVRLAVRAAGVNPFDWKVVHGYMAGGRPLESPAGLGSDVAGIVDQVGAGVNGLSIGDEVLGAASSPAYAEYALADPSKLIVKPSTVPWEIAGSLAVVGGTAYKVLKLLELSAGERLLVHAAAGGVGLVAVQLAVQRGVRVIGTASESNHELLSSLGVEPVTYGDGLAERVRALAPDGVDAVFDASGRGELALSVELAGGPERVITIAAADAAEHGVRFHGGGGGEDTVTAMREILTLIEAGDLQFPIWRTYPLEQAAAALAESESGHARGKIVLLPGG